ncbi:MAG: carbohydrate ABC transporter substrate-binding protein [Lachnospiraceae bacterium]|nr:carbohydrate ABC transporter substrate-binding protein [Lachnospiraceae bacterium]
MKKIMVRILSIVSCIFLIGCGRETPNPDPDNVFMEKTCDVTQPPKKQEITIALDYLAAPKYNEIIENFNATSEDYVVTVMSEKDDMNTFRDSIMKDMELGRGPDIIDGMLLNNITAIQNQYVQPWGEVFLEEEIEKNFFPGVFDTGTYEGAIYGIPYEWTGYILVTTKDRCNGFDTWNVEQMMEWVRASDAKNVAANVPDWQLFVNGMLYDKTNTDIIDWENKTCNFMQQKVYDYLKFIKEYGSSINYSDKSEKKAKMGEDFAWYDILFFNNMNYYEAIFGEEIVYISFPAEEGKSIHTFTELLYLNSACENKEGAVAFIRHLLSYESQNIRVKNLVEMRTSGSYSVRKDTMDYHIELEKNAREGRHAFELYGELYGNPSMTTEQEKQVRDMLDNLVFTNCYMEELAYRRVLNALDGYLDGTQTEEETAALMQKEAEEFFADMDITVTNMH